MPAGYDGIDDPKANFRILQWFWLENVKLFEDHDLGESLAIYGDGIKINPLKDELSKSIDDSNNNSEDMSVQGLSSTSAAKYKLHADVYKEILSSLRAGLSLRPPRIGGSASVRPVTLLRCPKDGGIFFLDSIVETIAKEVQADLVRLDADDIAQIVSTYVDENLAWNFTKTGILGYETQENAGRMEEYENEPRSEREEDEEVEDDLGQPKMNWKKRLEEAINGSRERKGLKRLLFPQPSSSNKSRSEIAPFGDFLPKVDFFRFQPEADHSQTQIQTKQNQDQWNNLKVSTVFNCLIDAAGSKPRSSNSPPRSETRDLIIQVRDFKELDATPHGGKLLRTLRKEVDKRWQRGRNIILVGTTATEEGESDLTKADIQHLQFDIVDGEKRSILVPPHRGEEQDAAFESDEKVRIRKINVRHIEDMIKKLADGRKDSLENVDIEKDLDSTTAYAAGILPSMEDAVFGYPTVHRLATTILGQNASVGNIDGSLFIKSWKILAASDEVKFTWGAEELKQEDDDVDAMLEQVGNPAPKTTILDRIKQIGKTCTVYEKKLLGGVILPSDIRTTFTDVRAPEETIEGLKMLTSLSLSRPEAFSYGVLATDKIPGLLLYGPPGTGKTLLAKAVAKESGATVLEVSGAEVNDMYVGEGEKNVKAIFTLAKKLSPCVVFIDEADALLASRSSKSNKASSSHRDVLNQFLREWDGVKDLSAFIMVATNRPFDLDEAVLRRLPRRLLVDLPVEKDREAILKIHLKDETLDPSVSLSTIAKNTPFYSGSDLKNVSVSAALACIREENEEAKKHTGEEPYVFPAKRILTKRHFDKALEEISASISEDMSTLTAIRRFDEKYGDRKGRRKKATGMGFGGSNTEAGEEEGGRVRKITV
jgi:hypothetical protein